MVKGVKEDEDGYISEKERKQLLEALHCRLFWVGQYIPHDIELEGKEYPLHEYVWELIHKEEIMEEDKKRIDKCIQLISEKEEEDEKELEESPLTREEAKALYHETAGLLRAIMDLREIEDGTMKESQASFQQKFAEQRVRDAKLWLEFLKKVKK